MDRTKTYELIATFIEINKTDKGVYIEKHQIGSANDRYSSPQKFATWMKHIIKNHSHRPFARFFRASSMLNTRVEKLAGSIDNDQAKELRDAYGKIFSSRGWVICNR